MKTLYIECKMGVAGDMLNSALLELVDRESYISKMNSLGIPDTEIIADNVKRNGIAGTHIRVVIGGEEESEEMYSNGHHHDHEHHSHHHSSTPADVSVLIKGLDLPDGVKSDALSVYELLAEAESSVHGTTVQDIHFHEVGTKDAIADIVGVCLLINMISPDKIIVSPINVGSGMVKCAHGILPVPAPATAYLLKGVPSYSDDEIETELCTPTGAALVKYFADEFKSQPIMRVDNIGYGFGTKEFKKMSAVRAFIGEEEA